MSVRAIRSTLETHLAGTVGIPDVVHDNQEYARVVSKNYIRANFVVTSRRPSSRGPNPMMRVEGFFVLNVYTPHANGPGANETIVELLLARFEGSTSIQGAQTNVSIEHAEIMGQGFEDVPFYCTPVIVSWYAYT